MIVDEFGCFIADAIIIRVDCRWYICEDSKCEDTDSISGYEYTTPTLKFNLRTAHHGYGVLYSDEYTFEFCGHRHDLKLEYI